MSDNKKYYYLKLKENFYEQDHIKYIESHENGYIFSNIIMKLYLRSIKHEGCLRITEQIPYDPNNIVTLSKVIGHDPSHVGNAINLAINLGIMTIKDGQEMWFTDIQNYIGQSSTEGDRKRLHRQKIQSKTTKTPKKQGKTKRTNVRQMSDVRPPEIELELELELDKDTDIKADNKSNNNPLENNLYEHPSFNSLFNKYPTKIQNDKLYELMLSYGGGVVQDILDQIAAYRKKDYKDYYRTAINWMGRNNAVKLNKNDQDFERIKIKHQIKKMEGEK